SSSDSIAAFSPISGFAPAPSPPVTMLPSWILVSHSEPSSACASVLQTRKSHPSRPEEIMLLTALPPAPPTPTTVIFGDNLGTSVLWILRLSMGNLLARFVCDSMCFSGFLNREIRKEPRKRRVCGDICLKSPTALHQEGTLRLCP